LIEGVVYQKTLNLLEYQGIRFNSIHLFTSSKL
jgi:hypothetical protein